MRSRPILKLLGTMVLSFAVCGQVYAAGESTKKEDYQKGDLPPGVQVVVTELEGPVFATEQGKTLYRWPKKDLRNGNAGDVQGKSSCSDAVYHENAGLMSPYPPGLTLPEVDRRLSCAKMTPPLLAPDGAKPVGKWTVIDRPDSGKQWAYEGWPVYTSILDKRPGDVLGGSNLDNSVETGASRVPVGPDPNVPPQFAVHTTMRGRLITLVEGWSVYTYDKDGRNKSNCKDEVCLDGWEPILAAAYARPLGEWTIFERAPGVKQWAFRGAPLYRYETDRKQHAMDGSDLPGWQNVYTQLSPAAPKEFALKDTMIGSVLGDAQGKTIYRYRCTDDAVDQQLCDYPDAPQAYRFAVCGGGDVERCLKAFPYVLASRDAKSPNQTWTTMDIDPQTGKVAKAGEAKALHVWAYRGRPVYTFSGDKKSSDILAHAWGEFNGLRNGYMAMVYRDVFSRRDE